MVNGKNSSAEAGKLWILTAVEWCCVLAVHRKATVLGGFGRSAARYTVPCNDAELGTVYIYMAQQLEASEARSPL